MQTRQYRNLADTIRSVQGGKKPAIQQPIVESVEAPETPGISNDLVEGITEIIADAEARLGTQFTAEEITYSTNYILEQLKATALVEAVQNYVGFELNEDEIAYVFNTLNESLGE